MKIDRVLTEYRNYRLYYKITVASIRYCYGNKITCSTVITGITVSNNCTIFFILTAILPMTCNQ